MIPPILSSYISSISSNQRIVFCFIISEMRGVWSRQLFSPHNEKCDRSLISLIAYTLYWIPLVYIILEGYVTNLVMLFTYILGNSSYMSHYHHLYTIPCGYNVSYQFRVVPHPCNQGSMQNLSSYDVMFLQCLFILQKLPIFSGQVAVSGAQYAVQWRFM